LSSNAPSTNKNSVSKDQINSKNNPLNKTSGDIKEIFSKQQPAVSQQLSEIILNNNALYDIDECDEAFIVNGTSSLKMDIEVPANQNLNLNMVIEKANTINTAKAEISKIDAKAEKRKNKNLSINNNSQNSKNVASSKHSKIKHALLSEKDNRSSDSENMSAAVATAAINNNYADNDNEKPLLEHPKKKIKKTRKVKIMRSYKDEDGYDVTSEALEDEEYWTDEKSEASASNRFRNNLHQAASNKPLAAAAAKKTVAAPQGKKGSGVQKSLESFFKK